MTWTQLYPAMVNSPETKIAGSGISDVDTVIPVLELGVFPDPGTTGNTGTIGDETELDPETILYTGKSAATGSGNLTGVTRGYDTNGTYGLARGWDSGVTISRNFTAHDWNSMIGNVEDHSSRHESGGDDAIKLDDLAAPDANTDLNATTTAHGLILAATAPAAGIRNVVAIDNTETVYKNTALVDNTNPAALGTVSPGTSLIAARRDHVHTMPTLDGVAAPTDVTTLNVSASAHGLAPKFPNNATTFFRGDGTYAAPPKAGVLSWSEVTGTTQACAVNVGYILNHATTMVVATLPSTASVGDVVRIVGKGAAMWKVAQNASQYIRFAGLSTTTGTGGYLQAENAYDCVELLCTTANNGWTVISSIGNIVVV